MAVTVDLRRRQPTLRSTGNLSMAIYVTITPDSTPESIADDIRRQLEDRQDCVLTEGGDYLDMVPLWLMKQGVKLLSKWQHATGHYALSALVSNVGRLDTKPFCGGWFHTETLFVIPPRMDSFPAFIGITGTLDNRLEVVASVPNMLTSNGRLDQLIDDIKTAFA